MIRLKIDNTEIEVAKGTTILEAAGELGIDIPTMCYLQGYHNHPSCMVCMVKDKRTGKLHPSCAMPAQEGMDIVTGDKDVLESRKEALELLLSDHVGDCEAPCRLSCPAFMDIPLMNRLIAEGEFEKALKVIKEDIALPLVLGYVCPAPCEQACKRKQIDNPVSICLLKKYVADKDARQDNSFLPAKESQKGKKVAVIGSGPAGLAAAFHLLKLGYECTLCDKDNEPGGTLLKIAKDELPKEILEKEIEIIKDFGARFVTGMEVTGENFNNDIVQKHDAVIIATGNIEVNDPSGFNLKMSKTGIEVDKEFFTTSDKGIFAAGSAIRPHKMAVRALAQGKEAAYSVHAFLSGEQIDQKRKQFNSKFGILNESEYDEYLKESDSFDRITPKAGKLKGFSAKEAILEAERCLHCDCRKPDSCKLRIYADKYHADQRKYKLGERKNIRKHFQHNEVVYEEEKCIRCGLCIDIVKAEKELTGLTFIGRGFNVKIDIPFNRGLQEALIKSAEKVVKACPTGALSYKDGERK